MPGEDLDFDLNRYLRASRRLDLSGVAWDRVADHPLCPEEVFCLHYMMDIETHTVVYLRDLLVTRAVRDPYVTAFLSCWVYEELWHGEAFSAFLRAWGSEVPAEPKLPDGSTPLPSRPRRTAAIREALGIGHRLGWLLTMASSALTRDFVAVHMTWGAVNELTTLTAYHQLIRKTSHPVLVDVLRRIIRDERRHFAFYRQQARLRLARSPAARRLTRWVMEHLWTPVGVGVKPLEDLDVLVGFLFADREGREAVAEMDRVVEELPGLEGIGLLTREVRRSLARQGAAGRRAHPGESP